MTYIPGQSVFLDAIHDRYTKVPFTHMSAHRVREGSDNIRHACKVVEAIKEYVSSSGSSRHIGMLIGCVPEDVHLRLRTIPDNIERHLGYNVISGVQNLTLHGVPQEDIEVFLAGIKPRTNQIRRDCALARKMLQAPIKQEYRRLTNSASLLPQLCADAAQIGDDCIEFCVQYGALLPQP